MQRWIVGLLAGLMGASLLGGPAHAGTAPTFQFTSFHESFPVIFQSEDPCSEQFSDGAFFDFSFEQTGGAPASGQFDNWSLKVRVAAGSTNLATLALSAGANSGSQNQAQLTCTRLLSAMRRWGLGSKAFTYTVTVLSGTADVNGQPATFTGGLATTMRVKQFAKFAPFHAARLSAGRYRASGRLLTWSKVPGGYAWVGAPRGISTTMAIGCTALHSRTDATGRVAFVYRTTLPSYVRFSAPGSPTRLRFFVYYVQRRDGSLVEKYWQGGC